mgnify:CR=1 FL=1|tara:strand:+ start:1552 stop:1719 length:168 start_codon:yes stop_codon:yes gene_type:complete
MTAQFERLRQDVSELEIYIEKLRSKEKQDNSLIGKLMKKKQFLIKHITEKQVLMQ